MFRQLAVLLSIIGLSLATLRAQAPELWPSSKILHELNRYNTLGSVLYIAAHPDDENTRLISWLVGERKLRTAYVSLTRGDGGQNLIGKEQGPLLGLIRTQELLAARRVDGAEQYFTRAYDFGYSKNPEETLAIWNQDSILADLVALIRQLKPDVIICRFPTTGEGGHGHHTASAILGQQAFEKAADPDFKVASGLDPWQAKSIFWNTYSFGTVNTTSEDQLWLDAGTYNPLLGKSYGEIASLSRSQHKSQGFGTAAQRGQVKEYFLQWGGDAVRKDILEQVDISWNLIPDAESVANIIDDAIRSFNPMQPPDILPQLLKARSELRKIQTRHQEHPQVKRWIPYKLQQLEELIFQAAGLWLSASVTESSVVPGDSISVRFDFIHQSNQAVELKSAHLDAALLMQAESAPGNSLRSKTVRIKLRADRPYTSPYWLENGISNGRFSPVADIHGLASDMPQLPKAEVLLRIGEEEFEVNIPLKHRFVNPVDGELFQPVMVLPPVTLQWSEQVRVFPEMSSAELRLQVKSNVPQQQGELRLQVPDGWQVETVSGSPLFNLASKGDVAQWNIRIQPKANALPSVLKAMAVIDGQAYPFSLEVLDYPHIPRQSILKAAELKLVPLQVKTEASHIGYIAGAGDDIPLALQQLGYKVTEINEANFERIPTLQLDAIVTGIRAYNNHTWLNDAYPVLMQFISEGGCLLVQYNTNNRLGPLVAKMSPYDLEITRNRVTVEEAPVTFLLPGHKVMTYPNQLGPKDFENWVQERGIYFAGKTAPEFEALFSMNDPGEQPLAGSTVMAKYGKGTFIYTGLSLFRQLPAGVPGAYRLLVNLLESKY
jgi:LmbE family N-acetylglucosaminyl deacetylase